MHELFNSIYLKLHTHHFYSCIRGDYQQYPILSEKKSLHLKRSVTFSVLAFFNNILSYLQTHYS